MRHISVTFFPKMLFTYIAIFVILNTYVVPQPFNNWSNNRFAGGNNQVNRQMNCGAQWSQHRQCMKDHSDSYHMNSQITDEDRSRIRSTVQQCYKIEGCADPFVPIAELNVKKQCYFTIKNRVRDEMSNCIRQQFADFVLPDEDDSKIFIGQDMLSMRARSCQASDKRRLYQCVGRANGKKAYRRPTSNYCETRYNCFQSTGSTEQCFRRGQDVRRALCACNYQLNIERYKNDYLQCLQSRGYPARDQRTDYVIVMLNRFRNSSGGQCRQTTSDPCGGFNGRQIVDGNGRNQWRGGDNSGDNRGAVRAGSGDESSRGRWSRPSSLGGNNRGTWTNSGSTTGNGWPQTPDGSNNRGQEIFNGGPTDLNQGTNWSGSSSGSNLPTNGGNEETDFSSLMSGGGIFPSAGSTLSGAGQSGNGISGFDLSSIFNGGLDISSLFNGLGGFGSGGGWDFSQLLSGFGTG